MACFVGTIPNLTHAKCRHMKTNVEQTGALVAPAPRSRLSVWYKAFEKPRGLNRSIVSPLNFTSNGTARRFSCRGLNSVQILLFFVLKATYQKSKKVILWYDGIDIGKWTEIFFPWTQCFWRFTLSKHKTWDRSMNPFLISPNHRTCAISQWSLGRNKPCNSFQTSPSTHAWWLPCNQQRFQGGVPACPIGGPELQTSLSPW